MKSAMSSPMKRLAAKTAFIVAVTSLLGSAATTAHAGTNRAASWPTTVNQAQIKWPGAKMVKLGAEVHVGRYIFKDPSGHYGLLSFSASVSALNTTRQKGHPSAVMSSDLIKPSRQPTHSAPAQTASPQYCIGCAYTVEEDVSLSSFLWGDQWLHTANSLYYGYYVWNATKTPGCSGEGSCQPPDWGVIGNNTSKVNVWENLTILYFYGNTTRTDYFRTYVNEWAQAWGSASSPD